MRQLFKKLLEKTRYSPAIADYLVFQVARIATSSLLFTIAQFPRLAQEADRQNIMVSETPPKLDLSNLVQTALNGLTYGILAQKSGLFSAFLSHFGHRLYHLRSEFNHQREDDDATNLSRF
jgi:hypothetical protein